MILISTVDLVRGSRVGDLMFPSLVGSLWLRFVIRRAVIRVGLVVFRVTGTGTGTGRLNSRSGSGPRLTTMGVRFVSVRLVGAVLGAMA